MNKNDQYIYDDEINKLKKFYENIIGLMPGHVYWKDENCVYMGCNDDQAESLNLASRQEIVGKTDYDFSPKEIADEIRKIDLSIIQTGESKSIEETIIKHGSKRIVLSKKVPLRNEDNKIIGLLGISFDITAEKEAEQLRLDKTILEEREATTRLIAASMAHELRTPLSAITMGMEGIEGAMPELFTTYQMAKDAGLDVPFMPPAYYKSLSKVTVLVKQEARSALSMIDILLMNTSTSHIDKERFKIQSIAQCVDDALTRYPLHEDEVKIIHWEKSDFSFFGDEILMTHVLFNLLKNALYYLKAANKGDIRIWCEQNDKYNLLYFKDTGLGIDPEIVPHVFDRFYTRTRKGTGVGLAFCKLVMQSFGGDISCESVKGEYAQFIMTFPKLDH